MNDLYTVKDQNNFATVEEYRKAKADGALVKADRIKEANPDLTAQFQAVDTVCK